MCEFNEKIVNDKTVVFCLGAGQKKGIPKGIELALRTFLVKEKSRLILTPEYAWTDGSPKYGIPWKSNVTYYIKLNKVVKVCIETVF